MPEYVWYFAYGSNMKESRLRERKVQPSEHKIGYIDHYTFRYNKIGSDKTGKGNIVSYKKSRVWGVFFRISIQDYRHLHETYEKGYDPVDVEGTSGQESIQAKSFVALPEHVNDSMRPSSGYHEIVIAGAREKELPEEYIMTLEKEIIEKRPYSRRDPFGKIHTDAN